MPLHTEGRKTENVLHDRDHVSCCGCLGGTAGPQSSSHLPDRDFLLLLPGLNQHGVITKYIEMAKREMNKLLKQKEKKNE